MIVEVSVPPERSAEAVKVSPGCGRLGTFELVTVMLLLVPEVVVQFCLVEAVPVIEVARLNKVVARLKAIVYDFPEESAVKVSYQ